jgi:GH15 family glucan-1,4-alpha-glucosidase
MMTALKGGEGAFTTCTFWYVECLARAGRLDEARLAMSQGISRANHLGLFSEELDKRGRQLGNVPQALTHLAFISAAHFLTVGWISQVAANGSLEKWP